MIFYLRKQFFLNHCEADNFKAAHSWASAIQWSDTQPFTSLRSQQQYLQFLSPPLSLPLWKVIFPLFTVFSLLDSMCCKPLFSFCSFCILIALHCSDIVISLLSPTIPRSPYFPCLRFYSLYIQMCIYIYIHILTYVGIYIKSHNWLQFIFISVPLLLIYYTQHPFHVHPLIGIFHDFILFYILGKSDHVDK